MKSTVKRYGIAFIILTFVIILMLGGTLAVKDFGDNMFKDTNVTMKPKGEHLDL